MTEPDTPLVLSDVDTRGVHTLTLNRPQARNALSSALRSAFFAALLVVCALVPALNSPLMAVAMLVANWP